MLDADQEKIASHLRGGLLVLAPVGTGKTWTLAERVARALESGFPPERVLCLTFTNRAAQEIANRLAKRFSEQVNKLTVKTFHGLCTDVLRTEAKVVGLPADFTVCDEEDSIALLRDIGPRESRAAENFFWDMCHLKLDASSKELAWPPHPSRMFTPLGEGQVLARRYQEELGLRQMLDFADLVLLVGSLFARVPDVRARWAERFEFVQVDEVQDTHKSEYRVVYVLARKSGNLALFGDVDQTIYEWRGSDPTAIIDRFRQDFHPVTELSLTVNRRATRRLVRAASSFAQSLEKRRTQITAGQDCPEGDPITLHHSADGPAEARWIGQQIGELANHTNDFAYRKVCVLTGMNLRGVVISQGFEELDIPHVNVEAYEFFRRQEVKDALAYLRLVLNPADSGALLRILERLSPGIGPGTISRLRKAGEGIGFRLVDFLRPETFETGDPFGRLIDAYRQGNLTVFDVETTGRTVMQDDVIEIAATRLASGQVIAQYHELLKNEVPVGDSIGLHGLGDDYLARNGQPPAEVLASFFAFCQADLLVGHNIRFDLMMVAVNARRRGVPTPSFESADTLDIARRFIAADDFSLAGLAGLLSLKHPPSHRSKADVAATCDLLAELVPRVEAKAAERRALVAREKAPFAPLAESFQAWRSLAQQLRPAPLLERVLEESGLAQHYANEPRRLQHLQELIAIFQMRDETRLDPLSALTQIVNYAALVRNIDHLDENDDRVRIITIHQAKGLEFDTVFIAGLHEDELPRRLSIREDRLEEERRLFYVALTRAQRRLYLSFSSLSYYGYSTGPSRFLNDLDRELLRQV